MTVGILGDAEMRQPLKALTTVLITALGVMLAIWAEPASAAPGAFADPAISPPGRLAVTNPVPGDPVTIATGRVSGTLLSNGVKAYFGIPFAAPPIRQYRWREPQHATHLTKDRQVVLVLGGGGAGLSGWCGGVVG